MPGPPPRTSGAPAVAEVVRERGEMRFERRMSDAEALMWNVERDPWLNPNGGMICVLDRPADIEQFRRRMRWAVAKIPRLRQHVVPGLGRLSPPLWASDPEFDFDYHVRHLRLPPPGSMHQLYELATRFYEDPFDRTRPLWVFVMIDGLEGDRSALFSKLHHSITDGKGFVRLSELYMERDADAPLPPEVDLDDVIALAVAEEDAEDKAPGGDLAAGFVDVAGRTLSHAWRRQAGIARRTAGEVALWSADPVRIKDVGEEAVESLRSLASQVGGGGEVPGGSPLWVKRSRRRHLESLQLSLDDVRAAGKLLGGTVNDVFVVGAVNGALLYHARRDCPVEALNLSFVVSTRTDAGAGGNAFTPTRLQVSGQDMGAAERFALVRDRMAERREGVRGEGALNGLAGLANLLPTSVVTRVARSQAAHMDFATSNIRAAPFPLHIAGAQMLYNACMGPVAGTAFNLTTVSYNGSLDIGAFVDPAAVEDPDDLRDCLETAYSDLLEAGGVLRSRR
jgi:diacylglycerol O-acyltransferase / wax synthase